MIRGASIDLQNSDYLFIFLTACYIIASLSETYRQRYF